jgi:hypothetical protein
VTFTDDRTIAVPTYLLLGAPRDWHCTTDRDGRVDVGGRRLELLPGHYQLQAGLRRADAGGLSPGRGNAAVVPFSRRLTLLRGRGCG